MARYQPLGDSQINVLRALEDSGVYPGRWTWHNHSTALRILEALLRRGYVETYESTGREPVTHYQITDAGRAAYRTTNTYRRSQTPR
jgi:DNA-binding PadR family transcriptional regulator